MRYFRITRSLACAFTALALISSSAESSEQAKCVQVGLANIGYKPGSADGVLGQRTKSAASRFVDQFELNLPELDNETAETWCDVIKDFARSPQAMALRDQTTTFKKVQWNGAQPSYDNDVVAFSLMAEQCGKKTYGDGRGESDCNGGRVRSQIQAPGRIRVGQNVEYYMEFFIPEDFAYEGDGRYPSLSRLLIAEWTRNKGIKNHIYEILLDNKRGVTFERETCITKDDYGKWNSFSLRIKWSKGEDGYMEARCNDRLVLERRGEQTVIPPDCASDYKLQCELKHQKPNASILWNVGPNFSGYGSDYEKLYKPTPFAPFPSEGIKLSVRNLYVGNIN